ncbi:MAG: DUF427 domain-containing protein [Pseudomonadota bacterium]
MQATDALATTPGQESYHGYRVVIEPVAERVRAQVAGEVVADSAAALVMRETRLPSVYYFPREAVRQDLLEPSGHRTNCPFKGNATYWHLVVGGVRHENAVWSYEDPFDESLLVKGYMAISWDVVDRWLLDERTLEEQPRGSPASDANPLVRWLVQDAWQAKSTKDLVASLAHVLLDDGFPLWRLRLMIRTLNPQLFALTYTWQSGEDKITEYEASHTGIQSAKYQNSPFAAIISGEGGIRRRLEGPNAKLDYPVLEDLVAEGATDYVAMPMRFSDGQINILVLVSDAPGGFTTEQLGQLYEVLPNLARQLEAHAQRVSSLTLLKTYLGRNAGQRVMDGLIKRGDGEGLHAAIWLSDLRGSTVMAETMSREAYLAALNEYFDAVAGAVIDQGGEVLKFIGDAVLAIFPIDDPRHPNPDACGQALAAVRDAEARLMAVNDGRRAAGQLPLEFGVGLHRGDLMYGNIGTAKRLDFTVIGPAVNEASRIEGLCKPLGRSVLISAAFAESYPGQLTSLGKHVLRGVAEPKELFTL